jgi:hypothetical protein
MKMRIGRRDTVKAHTHIYIYIQIHTSTHKHACAYAHTHTHTHALTLSMAMPSWKVMRREGRRYLIGSKGYCCDMIFNSCWNL